MTQKFIGNIKVEVNGKDVKVGMPASDVIPPKQEWSKYPIWQFNGKAYKPLTAPAQQDLDRAVKEIEAKGFTAATKEAKWKPTSIRYAILTTGVEPFYFI